MSTIMDEALIHGFECAAENQNDVDIGTTLATFMHVTVSRVDREARVLYVIDEGVRLAIRFEHVTDFYFHD